MEIKPTQITISGLSKRQVAALLPEAIAKLPIRQRRALIWRYYEERSFEEIARLLGVKTATAHSLYRQGLKSLRKRILPSYGDAS